MWVDCHVILNFAVPLFLVIAYVIVIITVLLSRLLFVALMNISICVERGCLLFFDAVGWAAGRASGL